MLKAIFGRKQRIVEIPVDKEILRKALVEILIEAKCNYALRISKAYGNLNNSGKSPEYCLAEKLIP